MLKFSCGDFAFPHLPHENALKLIKLMEINCVDIGLFENRSHIQPSGELANPSMSGALLKRKTADCGLEIADIFMQTSLDFKETAINHPDAKIRKEQRDIFRKLCDYAQAGECAHISGLPGAYFDKSSQELCIDELCWRTAYAKEHGLCYAVEAHYGSIIEKPADTLTVLKAVPGLTLTLDHSHYTFQGIPLESLRPLMDYASHIHVRGARQGEMQCSVERSETDFALIAAHMQNYTGKVCIEYTYTAWENCNRTDNVSETILLKKLLTDLLTSNGNTHG